MLPTLGYIALIVAMASAVVMGLLPLWPSYRRQFQQATNLLSLLSYLLCGSIALSFACLVYSFAVSDFSVALVALNSHTAKPMIYKISGAWGNHEGSMLLWVLTISIFTALFARFSAISAQLKRHILVTQGWISFGFLCFILFTSNPFIRLSPVPINGLGLNPLLQDIGLAMHPPVLYAGYVGFSIAFSAAIALLLSPQESAVIWAKKIKSWVLASWALLTLGVGLGSWWAYRELGWGGFWFWDPVENASLMPWLSGTALIHSMLVLAKRDALKRWCILLSILTFSLSLIGTFLVRSGVLTSVHAFANDPSRGVFILALLAIAIVVAFGLFAWYAPQQKSTAGFAFFSREGVILISNVFILTACATVVLGTLYPLLLEVLTGEHITVGAPYFNRTFNLIALPVVFLAFVGVAVSWGQDRLRNVTKKALFPLMSVIITLFGLGVLGYHASVLAIIAITLAVWLLMGTQYFVYQRIRKRKPPSPLFAAMVLAHSGIAILVLGIAICSQWQEEKQIVLQQGKSIPIAGYTARLEKMEVVPEDNFITRRAVFAIQEDGIHIATLTPETRFYPVENSQTTESAIHSTLFSNIYIALGDIDDAGNIAVRFYSKPGINLIWLGVLLMAVGGIVATLKKKES